MAECAVCIIVNYARFKNSLGDGAGMASAQAGKLCTAHLTCWRTHCLNQAKKTAKRQKVAEEVSNSVYIILSSHALLPATSSQPYATISALLSVPGLIGSDYERGRGRLNTSVIGVGACQGSERYSAIYLFLGTLYHVTATGISGQDGSQAYVTAAIGPVCLDLCGLQMVAKLT